MNDVVIVAGCRTPIGAMGGQFKDLTALDLSIPVMQALIRRADIDPAILDDVIWGCNYQRTYKENNLGRVAAVKAGIPVSVPGITIHRNCTSSMSAIQMAFYQIKAGEAVCILAGGADSMSTAPHMAFHCRYGQKFGNLELRDSMWDSLTNLGVGPAMGITAENVAELCGITREEQDTLAALSQKRAVEAMDSGKFTDEIIPVTVRQRQKEEVIFADEYPKRNTSAEGLSRLKTSFKEGGTVTAGNSSGMNDGASGVMLMSGDLARKSGVKILGRIVSTATTGIDPDIMGLGPVEAAKKAMQKAGIVKEDLGLIEINEAFAAQYLGCEKLLEIDREITNVNGSGISLGHPVGATGCRLVVTLMYEMKRRDVRYGLAALCAGGGMGTAVIVENVK